MTALLPGKPTPPDGATYALTVPQSVLFADLSLRGNKRDAFAEVFEIDYEPAYIDIDNGAMTWDYSANDPFVRLLRDGLDLPAGLERFIEAMGRTSREVEKTSAVLGSVVPVPDTLEALRQVLQEYWTVYELHMTSLFTFWNVENALSALLVESLNAAGFSGDVQDGLTRFLAPSEPNYFVRERANRTRLQRLFLPDNALPPSLEGAPLPFVQALEKHAAHYGFLLAPFNLGAPPGASAVFEALSHGETGDAGSTELPSLSDVPPELRRLGRLTRQFTFWKSERLDVMALADARLLGHYRAAANALDATLEAIFGLTRDELDAALDAGELHMPSAQIVARAADYCLVLADGTIAFYESAPRVAATGDEATVGTILQGTPASAGSTSGIVRIVRSLDDLRHVDAGDVLVTPMTRPEYGVALDRAAAFVTDEGGLQCHAAIIAREMKKPCVIATTNATSVLREGMTVAIDGLKGTVEVTAASANPATS